MKTQTLATAKTKERMIHYIEEYYFGMPCDIIGNKPVRKSDNKELHGTIEPYRGGFKWSCIL